MLDRPSSCPVQDSLCVSTEKLEMSGESSAELAACNAFAALAPTLTFFPSSRLSLPCPWSSLDQASRKHTPSERLAQDAALPMKSHQLHQMVVRTGKAKKKLFHTSSYTVQPPISNPMQNPI